MPGVGTQIIELFGILRRDDEPELVPILAPAFLEGGGVCRVGRRAVGMARPALAIDAFAFDVAQMRDGRAQPGFRQIDQPHLDRHAPGIPGQRASGEARRDMAAPKP